MPTNPFRHVSDAPTNPRHVHQAMRHGQTLMTIGNPLGNSMPAALAARGIDAIHLAWHRRPDVRVESVNECNGGTCLVIE